jgi:hypothetical protein
MRTDSVIRGNMYAQVCSKQLFPVACRNRPGPALGETSHREPFGARLARKRNTAFVMKEIICTLFSSVLHTGKRVLHSWLIVSAAIKHL